MKVDESRLIPGNVWADMCRALRAESVHRPGANSPGPNRDDGANRGDGAGTGGGGDAWWSHAWALPHLVLCQSYKFGWHFPVPVLVYLALSGSTGKSGNASP